MAHISQVNFEDASEEVREQFDYQIRRNGKITNMKKTLLHSLPAYRALMEWYALRDAVEPFLGSRGVNFFCYAISTENDCLICSTFFAQILDELNIDFKNFSFTEQEIAVIDYGRALVSSPHDIPDEIFVRLKRFLNEEQIVALTAFGSIMIATNLINTALKVELDEELIPFTRRR
jgi:alkylhydroperoxidase family enzyme